MKSTHNLTIMLAGALLLSTTAASALSGSGTSAAGNLDTVPPTVDSIAASTGQTIAITYSEAMLTAGATTAINYTASGAGLGTLSANPTSVSSGPSEFILTWSSGSGVNGQPISITVSGVVQDAVGNPLAINGTDNVASGTALPVELSAFHLD
mgnify:CR=1 FL=1